MNLEVLAHSHHGLQHRRRWSRQHTIPTIGALTGMTSGWVLPLISTNLLAWWSTTGGSVHSSGWLCLLVLPYCLRCFWAPWMEGHHFPWLDKRRSWAIVAQIAIVTGLIVIASLEAWGVTHPAAVGCQLFGFLVLSFAAGTLRASLDAYIVDVSPHEEHGNMAKWNVMFYRFSLFLMSGVALWVAEVLGWTSMFFGAGLVMLALAYGVMHLPALKDSTQQPVHEVKMFTWNTFVPKGEGFGWLLFLMLWCIGLNLGSLLGMLFLLKGIGMRLSEAGLINNVMGLIAAIFGGCLAPYGLRRLTPVVWIVLLLVLQLLVSFGYIELSKHVTTVGLWSAASVVCAGNFVVAAMMSTLVMVLMERCDSEFLSSQYAFAYSFPSILPYMLGPVAGAWVTHFGWTSWFNVVMVVSLLPFVGTPWSKLRTILNEYCK